MEEGGEILKTWKKGDAAGERTEKWERVDFKLSINKSIYRRGTQQNLKTTFLTRMSQNGCPGVHVPDLNSVPNSFSSSLTTNPNIVTHLNPQSKINKSNKILQTL